MKIKQRRIYAHQVACAKGWDSRKHGGLRAWRPVHTGPRDNAPEPDFRWGSREAREKFKVRGGQGESGISRSLAGFRE